jgi:F420-0:gamma-glutamyl ligase-like protein
MTHAPSSTRYALIVPTSAVRAAERVPAEIRRALRIDVYEVTEENQVRHRSG